jgi:GntR family transcriptional regulator
MADPAYRRIADSLRQDIEAGRLAGGDQLPTEQELAETWGASRSTIREAIRVLATRGLVEARPGQGTFVSRKVIPVVTDLSATHDLGTGDDARYYIDIRRQNRTPKSTVPRVVIEPPTSLVAAELGVLTSSMVVCRHQQRFIDNEPYSLQTSFYPMALVTERGAQRLIQAVDIVEGTIQYLRDALGIEQVGYRDVISVRTPDGTETDFFRLPEDGRVAVFENFRTSYDQDGHPIRLTVTVYPADRNEFVIDVPTPSA